MKILTVIGARPQFVKASVVSREISKNKDIEELIVHTGQHFDKNMSDIFFSDLGIPKPHFNLDVNGGNHGEMTAKMLIGIEKLILEVKPDHVLVYGDTNSTLAGALAASKLHIPISHIEAGLRSFNKKMPEEINRIVTDQLSDNLFCPTEIAVANLIEEGFGKKNVHISRVGDVMLDAAMFYANKAIEPEHFLGCKNFILATIHRAENTDDAHKLMAIVKGLNKVSKNIAQVIVPLHPRTHKRIKDLNIKCEFLVIEPVGYLEMLWLIQNSQMVITDSGGLQKEAYFFRKYCLTMRDQTEWVELVSNKVNFLVGADCEALYQTALRYTGRQIDSNQNLYGLGDASSIIVEEITRA